MVPTPPLDPGERDGRSVGRPRRLGVVRQGSGGQVRQVPTVYVQGPDVSVACADAGEGDLCPVGRPRRREVVPRLVGELADRARVVHTQDVHVGVIASRADEGDLRPVGRERGPEIVSGVERQPGQITRAPAHEVDLGIAVEAARREGDRRMTWRIRKWRQPDPWHVSRTRMGAANANKVRSAVAWRRVERAITSVASRSRASRSVSRPRRAAAASPTKKNADIAIVGNLTSLIATAIPVAHAKRQPAAVMIERREEP
jgi:hypothetical protein